MNKYYYVLDTFTEEELEIVRDFFWKKVYPAHSAQKLKTANARNGMIVTYFDLDDTMFDGDIMSILAKYPMLGRDCLITESIPGSSTEIHCDQHITSISRQCALNIPIAGCVEQSHISFYGDYTDYPAAYSIKYKTTFLAPNVVPSEVDKIGIVDKPALINTKKWHSIKNNGTENRMVFSWSLSSGMSYESALEELGIV